MGNFMQSCNNPILTIVAIMNITIASMIAYINIFVNLTSVN